MSIDTELTALDAMFKCGVDGDIEGYNRNKRIMDEWIISETLKEFGEVEAMKMFSEEEKKIYNEMKSA